MPVVISSSQRTTRLPIEFHIEPIGHLDRCCPAADQSACLDIPCGGREASHNDHKTGGHVASSCAQVGSTM